MLIAKSKNGWELHTIANGRLSCENDFFEDESFREEYSREKMVEKMQEMQTFFEGYGLDEYVEIYKNAEKFVKMYGDNLDT